MCFLGSAPPPEGHLPYDYPRQSGRWTSPHPTTNQAPSRHPAHRPCPSSRWQLRSDAAVVSALVQFQRRPHSCRWMGSYRPGDSDTQHHPPYRAGHALPALRRRLRRQWAALTSPDEQSHGKSYDDRGDRNRCPEWSRKWFPRHVRPASATLTPIVRPPPNAVAYVRCRRCVYCRNPLPVCNRRS